MYTCECYGNCNRKQTIVQNQAFEIFTTQINMLYRLNRIAKRLLECNKNLDRANKRLVAALHEKDTLTDNLKDDSENMD